MLAVAAALFHGNRRTDGQTEMTKLLAAFHKFAISPKRNSNVKCRIQEITGTARGFVGIESRPFIPYFIVIINTFMNLIRLSSLSWIRPLIADPPLGIGSDFKPVHMGFMVGKETLGHVSPRILHISPVIIFPPMLCTHI
jgi:hypothetical protein